MASLAYLFLAILATASAAPETRLAGGDPTTINDFPYIVAYTYSYPNAGITIQRCVGSLISSWHVLSSAFCFSGANLDNLLVRAGSTNSLVGGTVAMVSHFVQNPDYVASPRANDIAVSFLVEPLGITDTINVLYLPPNNFYLADGLPLKVFSWGFDAEGSQSDTLQSVTLDKQNLDECAATYADESAVAITDNVICASAAGKGTCNGDSGAPMVLDNVIVGVSSYFKNCGDDAYPDVFTRVDKFTNWILSVAVAGRSSPGMQAAPATL
ncbi:trypsin alpha-like [Trichoplusia ni]|uniref:Trypsin alpha-like n=1 Tax=Trichoplusia ni TaxID=7111 RepID=A0A7E5VZA9_TRINI|nr:trypsin alpha-like [Trichoplusia ni]